MKTIKIVLATTIVAFGLTFFLTKCKKNTDVVVVQVHDTVQGKSITGICKYPDHAGTMIAAPGTVISLYLGSSVSGSPVATAYADANGNYEIPYLLPNNYFVFASYNTENQNNAKPIEGITFETNPGYAVAMSGSNVTQNLDLVNVAPNGTLIIGATSADTIGVTNSRYAPFEAHSKCPWWTEYSTYGNGGLGGTTLEGGFNVFKVTSFLFDEANPANSKIKGYVLLSSINTMEPARDALSGCVPQTLQVDTLKVGVGAAATYSVLVKEADTAWYEAPIGTISKYGNGYLAKGNLTAFYKHQGGDVISPRVTVLPADTVSWDGKSANYAGPWNQRITQPVDMYFEYQGKNKVWNSAGTTYNWFFIFEGEFQFDRKDFYVKTTSIANTMHVTPHVQLKGANNMPY